MLKEKISKIFRQEGDNKKKVENLVFLLVILIVTIIAINYIWNDNETENNNTNMSSNKQLASTDENQEKNNENELETRLEDILSKIEGVGEVDVLITYNESTEILPIYNKTEKTSNTTEEDSDGGTRNIEETDVSQEVVYEEKDSNGSIATQKTVSPKIEGAIIAAEGAGNSNVKTSIIQAVEAATGLKTHKIQVFQKQN